MNMRQSQPSILVASDCFIFCIKSLLLNLNEKDCCRAGQLWPSEYVCRTKIGVSCDRSTSVCHLAIWQTLYKHVVSQPSPQSLLAFPFQGGWWYPLFDSILIPDGFRKCSNSNTLDVFWPAYIVILSGPSQMTCYVMGCPDSSCK